MTRVFGLPARIALPVLFTALMCVGTWVYFANSATIALDGWGGFAAFLLPFVDDATECAPDYSDQRFVQVLRGMTCDEVRALVGEPLSARTFQQEDFAWRERPSKSRVEEGWPRDLNAGDVAWGYTRRTEDASYRVRVVYFRDCKVIKRLAFYYVD